MKLPDRPNLRHLRDQAKDLVRAGGSASLADAQLQIARQYGFASWPKLKQHVESLELAGQLKQAVACNDVLRVEELLTSNAALRQVVRDDIGMPTQPGRTPMMELLLRYGADVNELCMGWFPVLFYPCENLEPEPLKWLLDHGADPNRGILHEPQNTALDYVLRTYPRHLNGTAPASRLCSPPERARATTFPASLRSFAVAMMSCPHFWMPIRRSSTVVIPNSIAARRAAG